MARVLIVDDIKIMRYNLSKMLKELGHTIVAEADCAHTAVEAYKKYKPDLVTMDITMPMRNRMKDGIEAVKEILKLDKDAKIIMVTSHGEEEMVISAIRAGAKNYILKPFTIEKLQEVLNKIGLEEND
jgi:two-component system chemotaxis response regulator CheY